MTHGEMFLRIGTAVLIGGAIGLERQVRERPAGLRTHLLVSLASATFMLVSAHFVPFQHYVADGVIRADVSRIASGVVMGIGFLGAGAIWHKGSDAKGLTTAASLWLVTALGLASGAGMFVLAWTAALVSLFVLFGLWAIEKRGRHRVRRRVLVVLASQGVARSHVIDTVRTGGHLVEFVDYDRDLETNRSQLEFDVRLDDEDRIEPLATHLESLPGVARVVVRTPDM
jgi:putative Mg2+ transporter-C (MgtC) family protein